ncbi:Peroxisomal succinyl-coenzyme A thioesterase-like [Homarus americanus]|uniref:Peroxisomal succinyl-coenzyme A thioesterase-like n=1 Tax=Homarus americanus TaxID=6706 RepID=A0A8J5KEL2_HOMAM|nr:Peroxisomal succinyl-coenzyme A thioesterase-like [Homarus americanus]
MTVHKGHLSDEALCSPVVGEPLATLTHLRHYMSPGVQRIPVRFGKVRGCLFLPPGNGPFPGVIDMFGSAGGLLEYRSAQLASRGFASLALAFFAYDDLPKHLEEFNIAYFEEAVEFLLKQEKESGEDEDKEESRFIPAKDLKDPFFCWSKLSKLAEDYHPDVGSVQKAISVFNDNVMNYFWKVFGDGVGVIGTSKGGDLALSMAAFIPSVHACIVINCCNTPSVKGLRVRDCFYTPLNHVFRNVRVSDEGVVFGKEIAQDPRLHPESIIPIEKSQSAFLFLVGSDDQNVKSEFFAQLSYQRLRDHSYPKHYEVSSYPGAGHLIEPPYSPHTPISFHNSYALPLIWGGTSKHHTLAQVQAWSKVLDFLRVHLAKGESISKHKCALKSHL